MKRTLLRTVGALLVLSAAAGLPHPAPAEAEMAIPWKLVYCGARCGGATTDCSTSNSAEYCTGFMTGCMGSCMLF